MPSRVDEQASFLFAFMLSIMDVRLLNIISRFFWPITDYLFSKFSSSNFDIEGLAAFTSMMSQLLVFTLDLVVYFVILFVVTSAIRSLK